MKKLALLGLIGVSITGLGACSNSTVSAGNPIVEGIVKYEPTQEEEKLLMNLGLDNRTQVISYKAPKEAKMIKLNAYLLDENGQWESFGGAEVSIGEEGVSDNKLEGTVGIVLDIFNGLEFVINHEMGSTGMKIDNIPLDFDVITTIIEDSVENQEIKLNQEIPLMLRILDDETVYGVFSIEDYFTPKKFENLDFVQVVTIEFTDKES